MQKATFPTLPCHEGSAATSHIYWPWSPYSCTGKGVPHHFQFETETQKTGKVISGLPNKSSNNQQMILLSQQKIPSKNTDANCNRTHYGSNRVVCVGKSILTFYNWLLIMTNTRITPCITVQGKGSARTAPWLWFTTLLSKLYLCVTWLLPLLPTVVRYQR